MPSIMDVIRSFLSVSLSIKLTFVGLLLSPFVVIWVLIRNYFKRMSETPAPEPTPEERLREAQDFTSVRLSPYAYFGFLGLWAMNIIGLVIAFPAVVVLLVVGIHKAPSMVHWITSHTSSATAHIVIAAFMVVVGWFLYRWKKAHLLSYGTVELALAISSSWVAIASIQAASSQLAAWVTLAGSAYVFVRGLENTAVGAARVPSIYKVFGWVWGKSESMI